MIEAKNDLSHHIFQASGDEIGEIDTTALSFEFRSLISHNKFNYVE